MNKQDTDLIYFRARIIPRPFTSVLVTCIYKNEFYPCWQMDCCGRPPPPLYLSLPLHTSPWLNNTWNFAFSFWIFCCHLSITSCSHEKRYQALPLFCTASDKKLGGAWEWGYPFITTEDTPSLVIAIISSVNYYDLWEWSYSKGVHIYHCLPCHNRSLV